MREDNCIECKNYKDIRTGCQFLMAFYGKKRIEKASSFREDGRCKWFEERNGCWNCLNSRYKDHRYCAPYNNEEKISCCENWVHHIEGKSW